MYINVCEICNKKFNTSYKKQKFCKRPHYRECEVCGKRFLIKNNSRPSRTCSASCASSLSHTDKSKEKRRINSLEKYGVEYPTQSKEVKKKIKETLDNSDNDTRIGSKRWKQIIKEKYNVENVSQLTSIKNKKENTFIEKYGVKNPMQSSEVIKKRKRLMYERYGTTEKKYINVKNRDDFMNLKSFLKDKSLTVTDLTDYFEVKRDKMIREIHEQNVSLLVKDFGVENSLKEIKFKKFIETNFPEIETRINDRTILSGKELDFYFPEYKLAVEISPSRTHNVDMGFARTQGVDKNYHLDKFLSCANKNIELITIFDWHDWDKILEMITHKLMKSTTKIFARNTKYIEEDYLNKEEFDMFNDYHILNLPNNFKRENNVGKLLHNDEVVGLALWVKGNNVAELKRMVFKPGYNVVGGPSKLLKNFIRNNEDIKCIHTFSDCDLGTGDVYKTIGFNLVEESKPQINYYHDYYKKHIRHLSLVRQGADRLLKNFPNYVPVGIGENLPSNVNILKSYNFLTVYDCGYRKWEYIIKE